MSATPILCDHGFYLADCALCEKRPGECDFGSCAEPATTARENRPMCERHGGGGETYEAFVLRVGEVEAQRQVGRLAEFGVLRGA